MSCWTDGAVFPVQLLPGDVLIMGSDGLWDNVDDNEILDLVLTVRSSAMLPNGPKLEGSKVFQNGVIHLLGAVRCACT